MIDEKEIGRVLERADSNLSKIVLACCIRAIFCVPLAALAIAENRNSIFTMIWLFVLLIVLFWPFHHLKDYVEFHEYGICYKGKNWRMAELGEIGWRTCKSNWQLMEDIFMDTKARHFAFTYIKDGKKKFNQAYMTTVKKN